MFVLPKDRSRPIILIGPGTGIVPAIAFLEEKKYIQDNQKDPFTGAWHLYFGCRSSSSDFIFKNFLEKKGFTLNSEYDKPN